MHKLSASIRLGTYLMVLFWLCSSVQAAQTVVIKSTPTVSPASPVLGSLARFAVDIDYVPVDPKDYYYITWDYGDGGMNTFESAPENAYLLIYGFLNGAYTSHVYLTAGTYTVKVTVENSAGTVSSSTQTTVQTVSTTTTGTLTGKFIYAEDGATDKSSGLLLCTLTLNNIDASAFNQTTPFSANLGGFNVRCKLGKDTLYRPGRTRARVIIHPEFYIFGTSITADFHFDSLQKKATIVMKIRVNSSTAWLSYYGLLDGYYDTAAISKPWLRNLAESVLKTSKGFTINQSIPVLVKLGNDSALFTTTMKGKTKRSSTKFSISNSITTP